MTELPDEYDFFLVVYIGAGQQTKEMVSLVKRGGKTNLYVLSVLNKGAAYAGSRTIDWDGSKMLVGNAVYTVGGIATTSAEINTTVCKIREIYGIKIKMVVEES